MEEIIRQVIESEYRAHKIIGEAEEERNRSAAFIENEIQKIKDDIFGTAVKKVNEIRKEKQRIAETQAEEIMAKAKESVSLMKQKFESNRRAWTESLFNLVIKNND